MLTPRALPKIRVLCLGKIILGQNMHSLTKAAQTDEFRGDFKPHNSPLYENYASPAVASPTTEAKFNIRLHAVAGRWIKEGRSS